MTRLFAMFGSVAIALGLWTTTAMAQAQPAPCDASRTPAQVTGQVVKVDTAEGKVTVRGEDGKTHEFQASRETLQDLKVGDRIEAKLRKC
jgi:Cu/Ag efflux protein CusF